MNNLNKNLHDYFFPIYNDDNLWTMFTKFDLI